MKKNLTHRTTILITLVFVVLLIGCQPTAPKTAVAAQHPDSFPRANGL